MLLSSVISAVVGAVGGFNQTHLRKLLAYSSINQLGWMLRAALLDQYTFFIYLLAYFFALCSIVFVFYKCQMYHIGQIYSIPMSSASKACIIVCFLALGGLPPFVTFRAKILIVALVFQRFNLV